MQQIAMDTRRKNLKFSELMTFLDEKKYKDAKTSLEEYQMLPNKVRFTGISEMVGKILDVNAF